MDKFARHYRACREAVLTKRAINFGGSLAGAGAALDRSIAANPTLNAAGGLLSLGANSALDYVKGLGKDMTYQPFVDGYHDAGNAISLARAGKMRLAGANAAFAGINGLSGAANISMLGGAFFTGGATEAIGAPVKAGLVSGARRLLTRALGPRMITAVGQDAAIRVGLDGLQHGIASYQGPLADHPKDLPSSIERHSVQVVPPDYRPPSRPTP